MAWSNPITWKHTMVSISMTEGFILPGIMDDPGWTAGNVISANPAFGPDDNNRRSFPIRISVWDKVRRLAEKSRKSAAFCMDSNKLPDDLNFNLVSLLNSFTIKR